MNHEEKLAPIVLFTYNRPWHTRQTVESLQKNELASKSELLIYSDAPKNENAVAKVNEVREYIKTIDGFKKITIIERDKNWGLANSIIDGVTNIVNQYGKIIVLEDDLVTSPYFLRFMNDGLNIYKQVSSVGQVNGFTGHESNESEDFYFMKSSGNLGWGTWKRVWDLFEKDTEKLIKMLESNKKLKDRFNCDGSYDYMKMLFDHKHGNVDSWAIRFRAIFFINQLYSLNPKKSLVLHIGNDDLGTHYKNNIIRDPLDVALSTHRLYVAHKEVIETRSTKVAHSKFLLKFKPPIYKRLVPKVIKSFIKRFLNDK